MSYALKLLVIAAFACSSASSGAASQIEYPVTGRGTAVTKTGGRTIPDPYRWLEGDPKTDPAVREWALQQNGLTRRYLDALPERAAVRSHLTRVWNYERFLPPRERGTRRFLEKNSGLQNQNVIVVQEGTIERVLVDPNKLSASGSMVVHDWKPSPSGDRLLYALQANGGDKRELRLVDVATGQDRSLELEGVRTPAFDWSRDGSGIFYTRYPTEGVASAVFFHRFGTAQRDDVRLFQDPSGGKLILWPRPTDDPQRLVIEYGVTDGTRSNVVLLNVSKPETSATELVGGLSASWRYVGAKRGKLYFVTTKDAPRGAVVSLDATAGAEQRPVTIGMPAHGTIQQAVMAGDGIVVRSLDGLRSHLQFFGLDGHDRGALSLPPLTVVSALEGESSNPSITFLASSLVSAPTLYRHDLVTGRQTIVGQPRMTWKPADFVVRQINARSADGTMVPVTLAYRRSLAGKRLPTLLMVYGGWGLSVDLAFYESRFAWIDMGGVFAIAHIRGGGEGGDAWHMAAMKAGHVRGIEDFAAAASTLQKQGITTPLQTVAYGSSNGGMMTTATINKHSELFGVAIPRVAVTDLVRFTETQAGRTWTPEIGDPANAAEIQGILSWSPLHNVAAGRRYPAVLMNTALGDDRVAPMHSFKYLATLQNSDTGSRPKLLRIEQDAGHGEGKSNGQLIDEFTDLWSFAAHETQLRVDD